MLLALHTTTQGVFEKAPENVFVDLRARYTRGSKIAAMNYIKSIGVGLLTVIASFVLVRAIVSLLQDMLPKRTQAAIQGDTVSWAISVSPFDYLLFLLTVFVFAAGLEYRRQRKKNLNTR